MKLFSAFSPLQNRDGGQELEDGESKKTENSTFTLFVPTQWSEPENDPTFVATTAQLEDLVLDIDRNIKLALSESSKRADALKSGAYRSSDPASFGLQRYRDSGLKPSLHALYTRLLSCVVLPVTPPTAESQLWMAHDFQLLRERCSKCGGFERVTEQQHRAAIQFLESDEGKGALMGGLNIRLEIVNSHPFYNREAFALGKGGSFESWKLAEVEDIERQKASLVTYTKREMTVEVMEVR
eukprot:CAMPEP_0113700868 /NCGR_PEP_ID=MMETSP0038_2-20120614/24226_1 /TAXON_ID=2898 /ORGANISM="Cryptomonas paramecium" /LENGTH=239 /DNA_ID=CAMNT_0000624633 /DNA_START=61 /DNA_END=776 /DNA_ORIENTATION=+ /assembly_acc=CAM_ASM_000170